MTALIVAVKGGYTDVVKELLKRNPNVNMTDKDGNTALAIAAKEGHVEIVQDLLDAGSYVNIPDRVRPAWRGRAEFLFGKAEVLQNTAQVKNKFQVSFRFPGVLFFSCLQNGETMLIGAVRGGHLEIVRALLNKYADIDIRGQVGAPSYHSCWLSED